MSPPRPAEINLTREQRIQAVLQEIQPQLEQIARQLVERALDVPEAHEFGPIDFEFRDAGQQIANHIRQASLARRKKRATSAPASPVRPANAPPNSTPTNRDDC